MIVHQQNHYRPFSSNGAGDGDGPTSDRNRFITNDIYDVVGLGLGGGVAAAGGGVVGSTTLLQPFDCLSPTGTPTAVTFKSPGGGMAASLWFPFTNTQRKELERQAMIYKYMMASVPVPSHLLNPMNLLPSDTATPHSTLGSGLNLKFTNGADKEPGRCRRTDGKKWRCSREVAPDQKYCERHMHRGRPRSRKPVEHHANINNKKSRHNPAISAECPVTLAISNPIVNKNADTPQFIGTTSQPYLHTPVFLDKTSDRIAAFDETVASASRYQVPRSLHWMMEGESVPGASTNQQWHHLVQTEIGLTTESSINGASVFNQHYQEEPLNLNSFGNFGAGQDEQSNQCTLFLNETPRSFIDAWSNGAPDEDPNANSRNTSSVSSIGKRSLSSLTLSMGDNNSMDEEMGQIQMGLSLNEPDRSNDCGTDPASWTATTPGGPLAEVLHLTTTTAASSPSDCVRKTLASLSDNSGGNMSPTIAKPEIALLWPNQNKSASSS